MILQYVVAFQVAAGTRAIWLWLCVDRQLLEPDYGPEIAHSTALDSILWLNFELRAFGKVLRAGVKARRRESSSIYRTTDGGTDGG
jgi:hypothetical protein